MTRRQHLQGRLFDLLIEHADDKVRVVISPELLDDLADIVAETANEMVQDGFADRHPAGCDTD